MLDSVKKFDNLKFKQKLILVYCISLITSLFLSICLLVVFCINILKKNYINNLDVVTKQVADNFERRVSDTEMQLFNTISMFQIPDYMSKMDGDKSSYAGQELGYMATSWCPPYHPLILYMLRPIKDIPPIHPRKWRPGEMRQWNLQEGLLRSPRTLC